MPGKLTERKIAALAKKHAEAKAAEAANKATKNSIGSELVAEFRARKTKALEAFGWRVNIVTQMMTSYSVEDAKANLSPKKFKAITKRVIEPELVAEALESGVITPEDLAKFSVQIPKSSYPNCTPMSTD